MRYAWSVLLGAALIVLLDGGCRERVKEKQPQAFNPTQQYPEWAYDAPFYYRPVTQRGDVGEKIPSRAPTGPTQYFTRSRTIYLPRPTDGATSQPSEKELLPRSAPADLVPRIAVYWTDSGGQRWERAGYFGVGQTHFAFTAENDGVYGFRYVGPGLPVARCSPPRPQEIYHVDTTAPGIVLYVEPNQPSYRVSQSIAIHWTCDDAELADEPVSISACWRSDEYGEPEWRPVVFDQPAEGTINFVVPVDARGRSFCIRGQARDRAGNLGCAFSTSMLVADVEPTTKPTSQPSGSVAMRGMSLSAEGELASFTTAATPSAPRTAKAVRSATAKSELVLPPLSTKPASAHRHWSARPWQSLSPDALRAAGVWALPVRRLPTGPEHVDRDVPDDVEIIVIE